ncbi:hypothetical protein BDN72DRAFT_880354 [Pluteus cervinus]|uniref:Uncharacterized protein n=1 Tax=Pluteus cervinus TaxID=181527 RepID=A0ACD3AKT4_9AGAR|nr:hypothetical protein BDN72DRAFT_880354 [Pluteus cervinus]
MNAINADNYARKVFRERTEHPPPAFETLLHTMTRAASRSASNSHLSFQTRLPKEAVLEHIVPLPHMHRYFKEVAERALANPPHRINSYVEIISSEVELNSAFVRFGTWQPTLKPTTTQSTVQLQGASFNFKQLIMMFYQRHISFLAGALASLASGQLLDPQRYRLEETTASQAGQNGSGESAQAVLVHQPHATTNTTSPGPTLAVWYFHDSADLNDGVWTALDLIAGRRTYAWQDSTYGEFHDPGGRSGAIDVIHDMDTFTSWGLAKPEPVNHAGANADQYLSTTGIITERDYHNARTILQEAWSLAVKYNTTFLVISNGNCERIGIRHRTWGTLFLSSLIRVSEDLEYFEYLVGLYRTSYLEASTRCEREIEPSFGDITVQDTAQLNRRHSGSPAKGPEALLLSVDSLYVSLDGIKNTWIRHVYDESLKSCGLAKSDFKEPTSVHGGLKPYPRWSGIGGGVLTFEIINGHSFFSYGGWMDVDGQRQKSNLVAKIAEGAQDCDVLCNYYRKYRRLARIRNLNIPEHYGLFQRNPRSGEHKRLIIIAENPGPSLVGKALLLEPQKQAFRDQLGLIHGDGFLHGGVSRENCHIGLDGATVCILGFQGMKRLNPLFDNAEEEKREEKEILEKILQGTDASDDEDM